MILWFKQKYHFIFEGSSNEHFARTSIEVPNLNICTQSFITVLYIINYLFIYKHVAFISYYLEDWLFISFFFNLLKIVWYFFKYKGLPFNPLTKLSRSKRHASLSEVLNCRIQLRCDKIICTTYFKIYFYLLLKRIYHFKMHRFHQQNITYENIKCLIDNNMT